MNSVSVSLPTCDNGPFDRVKNIQSHSQTAKHMGGRYRRHHTIGSRTPLKGDHEKCIGVGLVWSGGWRSRIDICTNHITCW